jgi:hypothetical protein
MRTVEPTVEHGRVDDARLQIHLGGRRAGSDRRDVGRAPSGAIVDLGHLGRHPLGARLGLVLDGVSTFARTPSISSASVTPPECP